MGRYSSAVRWTMKRSSDPAGRRSTRGSSVRMVSWMLETLATTSSGTLPPMVFICSPSALRTSPGSHPECRSYVLLPGATSTPTMYSPTTTTGQRAPTTPVKKSTRPTRASALPTRFLVLYRETEVRRGTWMTLPLPGLPLVIATDLLEHQRQRRLAAVEHLAAGQVGQLLEL